MTVGQRLPHEGRLSTAICLIAALPVSACVSSVDGSSQEPLPQPIEQTKRAARTELCAGRTEPGVWQPDKDGVTHVDVDTRHCGLGGDPLYFTSLGGDASHWAARGATSIYRSSNTGFRVVVLRPQAPELAERAAWYVNWMAQNPDVQSPGLCTGRTGSRSFKQYEDGGVRVKVDLRHCGFKEPPVVLTSLGGVEGHAATRGATSLYDVSVDGFTVFIQKPGITTAQAEAWGWHINWSASPPKNDGGEYCTGKSTFTDTLWKQYGANGLSTRLTTEGCAAPLVFATLSGDRSHWYTTGASSIYGADDSGFRIYVNRSGVTPAFASDNGWHVHWTRVTPTVR